MNHPPLVLRAYTPRSHPGDWQIVISVNRKRSAFSVESWHSSERPDERQEPHGEGLRIETGIRAFRRQMPVLSAALDLIDIAPLSDEEIVEAIFGMLAEGYGPALAGAGDHFTQGDLADFFDKRKRKALAAFRVPWH